MIYLGITSDEKVFPISMIDKKILLVSPKRLPKGSRKGIFGFSGNFGYAHSLDHQGELCMHFCDEWTQKSKLPSYHVESPEEAQKLRVELFDPISLACLEMWGDGELRSHSPFTSVSDLSIDTHKSDSENKWKTKNKYAFPASSFSNRFSECFQSHLMFSRMVIEGRLDKVDNNPKDLFNGLIRMTEGTAKALDIENKPRWGSIVVVSDADGDRIAVSPNVISRKDHPVGVQVHSVDDQDYIYGLRVYERADIPMSGSIIEAACLSFYEDVNEMISVSGKTIRHIGFISLPTLTVINLDADSCLQEIETLFKKTTAEFIQEDPKGAMWDRDYGYAAFFLLGRKPFRIIQDDFETRFNAFSQIPFKGEDAA